VPTSIVTAAPRAALAGAVTVPRVASVSVAASTGCAVPDVGSVGCAGVVGTVGVGAQSGTDRVSSPRSPITVNVPSDARSRSRRTSR
jgi:hypothetical protein